MHLSACLLKQKKLQQGLLTGVSPARGAAAAAPAIGYSLTMCWQTSGGMHCDMKCSLTPDYLQFFHLGQVQTRQDTSVNSAPLRLSVRRYVYKRRETKSGGITKTQTMNNQVIPTTPPTGREQRVCTWFPCLEKAAAVVLEVGPFLSAGLYTGPVRISHSTSLQQPYWGMRSLTLRTGHQKTFTKFIVSSILFFKPAFIS